MRRHLTIATLVLLAACGGGGEEQAATTTSARPTTTAAAVDVEAMLLELQGDPATDQIDLLFDCDLLKTIEGFAQEQAEPDGGRRTGLVTTEWNAFPEELIDAVQDDVTVRYPQLLQACEVYVLNS